VAAVFGHCSAKTSLWGRGCRGLSQEHPAVPHQPNAPVLMLRCFGFRPKGAEQIGPGQRPGNGNSRGKQALKGRNEGLAMLRPYGHGRMCCNGPRAMPGADLWLPLRGEYTRSPLQIRWLLMTLRNFGRLRCGRPIVFRSAKEWFLSRSARLWAGVASHDPAQMPDR
jgi:hypothetical protein